MGEQQITKGAEGLVIRWGTVDDDVAAIVDFFVANITPDYISATEIIEGRAIDEETWSEDLGKIVSVEFAEGLKGDERHIAIALSEGIVGVANVVIRSQNGQTSAMLEDMVVAQACRGQGIGSLLTRWVLAEVGLLGARRVYIECGVRNQGARRIAEKYGFTSTSIIMSRPCEG